MQLLRHRQRERSLPPVPSSVPIWKSTQTTTTDETTTTWTGVNIGEPHPKRLVILMAYHGVIVFPTATVNGVREFLNIASMGQTSHGSLLAFQVPFGGETADIAFSAVGSARKAVAVYVAYPEYPFPIDWSSTQSVSGTTPVSSASTSVVKGGFLLYLGLTNAISGSPYTTTWSGVDAGALVENEDIALFETITGYTHGQISPITIGSDSDQLTMSITGSGAKRLVVGSWGPSA